MQRPGACGDQLAKLAVRLCIPTPPATRTACHAARSVVHRCGEEILRGELPAKHEVVLKLALSPTQHRVYERYVRVGLLGCSVGLIAAGLLLQQLLCAAEARDWTGGDAIVHLLQRLLPCGRGSGHALGHLACARP